MTEIFTIFSSDNLMIEDPFVIQFNNKNSLGPVSNREEHFVYRVTKRTLQSH